MAAAERNRAGPRARGDASLGRVGTPPGRLAGGAVVGATSLRGAGRGCREALGGSQTDSAPCPVPSAWETRRPVGTVAVTGFQVRGSRGLEAGTAPGPTPSSGPWLPTSVIRGDVTRLRRPSARSAGAPGRRRVWRRPSTQRQQGGWGLSARTLAILPTPWPRRCPCDWSLGASCIVTPSLNQEARSGCREDRVGAGGPRGVTAGSATPSGAVLASSRHLTASQGPGLSPALLRGPSAAPTSPSPDRWWGSVGAPRPAQGWASRWTPRHDFRRVA